MVLRRVTVLLVLLTAAAGLAGLAGGTGCADTDPNYGPPQAIKGREIDFGGGSTPAPAADAGPVVATKSAPEAFADLFATLATCSGCHGMAQAPVFVKATSEETRAEFLKEGYDTLTSSAFYLKKPHSGPELTAAQKTLTQLWSAAEAKAKGDGG
jgi:cytochrome c553